MTQFAFPPAATPSLPVTDSDTRFPVRRIYCVGRNYAAHAREMGNDPDREPPFFFSKPGDALAQDGETLPYPPQTDSLHFEAELVVAISTGGADIPEAEALSHVWGYAIGNDLTRRDMQGVAKKMGRPWDLAKGFDRSAVCGAVHPVSAVGHPEAGPIRLTVNGAVKQEGDLSEMIWRIPEVIAILSRSVALAPGDLIFTGTPAGVGELVPGDTCVVEIPALGSLTTLIGPRG
ncbi:fumarylacetoacetate hydrolase family protein [Paroceanicella profunda]|uniref:Fumarylacetoacetate hydrolase family protein n=1 Tax=Paroceanicella profunda TaxID=2579971 RepID=A0A5B8FRR8_9RHOB|nr:fumarylacetoacetate hydrolase family protein [Paroceanicella profunda]QDL91055.1 fumarylacetoacetate hydrolase family protein [Paroceanicella profunda]